MKKKQSLPPVPPLSLEALGDVEELEELAQRLLHNCGDYRYFNPQKAVRILRTCVVQALDVQIAYYKSLPDYHPEWIREVKEKTIDGIVGLVGTNGASNWDFFQYEVRRTVKEHLAAKKKTAKAQAAKQNSPQSATKDRTALRDTYLAKFPNLPILDICWAAGQHYSEWKRWLRNAVKDNSAPDRAFRAILTSGTPPKEYRKQSRPKGWK